MRWVLVGADLAIAIGVGFWITREEQDAATRSRSEWCFGGALGNILDRVRHGYVVDFADLHFGSFRPFFIFNVADAAISIGVAILLLRAFLVKERAQGECRTCVNWSRSWCFRRSP